MKPLAVPNQILYEQQTRYFKRVFLIAAWYNLLWGLFTLVWPNGVFYLTGQPPINYPIFMAGLGMVVGLYGYGYWLVANNLRSYAAIAWIGALGKGASTIGWFYFVLSGKVAWPLIFFGVFNDMIWLPFFAQYFLWLKQVGPLQRSNTPLYQQLMQDSFRNLPAALKYFHSRPEGGKGQGLFSVVHGTGFGGVLAKLMGLPKAGQDIPVRLQVVVQNGKEYWSRYFRNSNFPTVNYNDNGLLVEQKGLLQYRFKIVPMQAGLRYEFRQLTWLGIPVPRYLAIEINGEVVGGGENWQVNIRFTNPLFGQICRYEGQITPSL